MVQPRSHYDPEIFFCSTTAWPVVPHPDACRCCPATKEAALVLSFSQILLISKPALECVDNSGVRKFTECSLYPTIQITAEITEKDMAELKLFAVIPFNTLVGFDIEPLLNWKTTFRKKFSPTYVVISFLWLCYLRFSRYHCDIKGVLPVPKRRKHIFEFLNPMTLLCCIC